MKTVTISTKIDKMCSRMCSSRVGMMVSNLSDDLRCSEGMQF